MCAFGPPGKPAFWIIEGEKPVTSRHVAFLAPNYFGAFAFDPDGNNVEAVFHAPKP